jgi:hypothetical protein
VHGAFSSVWYKPAQGQEKDMLAVAIAAISGNHPVIVYLSATDEYSDIRAFYLIG